MTTTPEPTRPPHAPSRESGLWILLKVIVFLFALPVALLYAIKLLFA